MQYQLNMTNSILKIKDKIYIWLISFSLILHVFNNFEIVGIKAFQIPSALVFLINITNLRKSNLLQRISILLIIFAIISGIFSPYPEAFAKSITFMVIIGACIGIPKINFIYLIRISNILLPISLLYLLILLRSSIVWRFIGAYNDPNYLCTTLLVFLFLVLIGFKIFDSKILKIFLIFEILIIIILAAATLSRTGLICIGILIIISCWEFIQKFKIYSLFLFLILGIYMYINTPPELISTIDKVTSREDEHGNLSSAKNLRFAISMRGITYVISHPQYIPFGMGIGSVGQWEYFDHYSNDNHIDHNTLSASFSELGIIGFWLYAYILYLTFP